MLLIEFSSSKYSISKQYRYGESRNGAKQTHNYKRKKNKNELLWWIRQRNANQFFERIPVHWQIKQVDQIKQRIIQTPFEYHPERARGKRRHLWIIIQHELSPRTSPGLTTRISDFLKFILEFQEISSLISRIYLLFDKFSKTLKMYFIQL